MFLVAVIVTASLPLAAADPPPSGSVLLRPARVFDAVSAVPHEGWVVLVTGDSIAAAGPRSRVQAPPGTKVIELAGMTLLPGLIDAHSHIFLHPYNETLWNDQVLLEPLAYRTILATSACSRHIDGRLHDASRPRYRRGGLR